MDLTDSDILDLMKGTLKELGRNTFFQIAQQLQRYEVMSRWLRKDKVMFDSGVGIQRTLLTGLAGAAKHVGLFEEDEVNLVDLLSQIDIPWRQAQSFWMWERRELLKNRGQALVVKVVQPRREGAMIDMAQELEDKAWECPALADKKAPYGIPYYVVKSAAAAGFNGGAPAGHTLVAGLNPTSIPAWKNYTWTYPSGSVTRKDFVKPMRTMLRKTKFISPLQAPDSEQIKSDFRHYTNESLFSDLEDLGEQQDDNLKVNELDHIQGQLSFSGNPIVWVPKLDADTDNPIYSIDHGTFFPVALTGDYLREADAEKAPHQHNVFVVFVDLSYNYFCINRRANSVAYKV